MRLYSHFFSTIYDQPEPLGDLGRGTHYSILRSLVHHDGVQFHDVAVIWDEDHDLRIVWVMEQLCAKGLLAPALAIGERKGGVTVLTKNRQPAAYVRSIEEITTSVPTDSFSAEVEVFSTPSGMIVNDSGDRVKYYLAGIDALWTLGVKPCQFTTGPFRQV